MSLRNRVNPQQLLAVSLALIMLVSMGGMAFVGGVGADTGGTYDDVIDESETVNGELNIASEDGDVQLVGPEDGTSGNVDRTAVDTLDNGDVSIDGSNVSAGQFAGAALTLDRVAAVTGAQNPGDQADFLSSNVDDLAVNSTDGEASPVIFIELDPQSNFSQIDTGTASVDGSHDYIVIGNGTYLAGNVTTDGNTTQDDSIVAHSVDNDGTNTSRELATGSDFGTVIDTLTGANEADLQNENIDDVQIAAGLFGNNNPTDTITGVQLNPSTMTTGETVHSEKITLVDAQGDERYFSSIADADGAAATDNTIRLDGGTYDDGVTLGTEGLTVEPDESGDTPAVTGTVTYNADDVTVDTLDVDTGAVDDNGNTIANPTLTNSTVDYDGTLGLGDDTAVDFNASTNATVTDNEIVADDADNDVSTGDTGLGVVNGFETVSGNDIQDFQTQIAATTDEDMDALLANNDFAGSVNDDAQAAVPVNDTDAVQGDTIYGSVDDADAAADAGETVEVYSGTYEHGGAIDITTEDVSLEDVDSAATIADEVDLNAAGDVSVDGFDLDGNDLDTDGSPSTLTVTDTEANDFNLGSVADVTLTGTAGDVYTTDGTNADITGAEGDTFGIIATDDVSVDSATVTTTGADNDGINVTSTAAGTVSVVDSVVTLNDADDTTGVNISTGGANTAESVTVTNVTVDADTTAATGIAVNDIDTNTNGNAYVINDSDVDVDNGVGLAVTEIDGDNDGTLVIDNNDFHGGLDGSSEFTGIAYNLPNTESVNITSNEIVGADTAGGANSVGVDFEEVSEFGSGLFDENANTMTFEGNVITGHARLVQDGSNDTPTVTEEDYSAIVTQLDNDLGTLVIGPDGDYEATFGSISDFNVDGGANASYLPGSVSQANALVEDNIANANEPLETTTLEVRDPTDVTVGPAPTEYAEDDATVDFPNMDQLTLTGENPGVTVNTNFRIDAGTEKNNHDITSLTIENSAGDTPAIYVPSDTAQSTFANLTVDSADDGLVVDADGADVNVIEVYDSSFEVDANGVELSSGTDVSDADDRDGFVLHNVSITGDGIGNGNTGLDLAEVDKPGKDGLGVNLTVEESDVNDFETQVALVDDDLDLTALDLVEETVDIDGVTIENNEFEQAVLVLQADGETDAGEDLFGSINAADGAAAGGQVIDVRNTLAGDAVAYYDHGAAVTINTDNVEVSGPVDAAGSQDLRNTEDEVVIEDEIVADTDTADASVTLDGFAVVTDQSSATLGQNAGTAQTVVAAAADTDLTVTNLSVTTTLDPTETAEMPIGIGAVDTGLTVKDTYVGAHNAPDAETTGTAVVAEAGDLTITDSVLNAGADGTDASNAFGVIAADATTPDLTRTTITDFDQAGLQVADDSLTITDGDISDNGNVGDVSDAGVTSTGVNAAATQYKIDGTTIEDNAGDGVSLTDVGLNLIDATVSDNNNGVVVASDGITVNNVSVTDSTVSDHDGDDTTGVDIDGANATVSNNSIANNTNGLTLSLVDDEVPVVTFNDIADNDNGLTVNDGADTMTLTGNDFANSVDIDNQDADGDTLDATLNYFDDNQGPEGDEAGGVNEGTGTVVYDPFLSESVRNDVASAAEVESTTSFAHDVVIPENSTTSVGFPAQPDDARDNVDQLFSADTNGTLYKWNAEAQQFEQVDYENDSVDAFDGYVVDNTGDEETVTIEYQSDRGALDTPANAYEFKKGLNFVPPQQAGTVNEALFPGGETDYVAQPFTSGDNLYGTSADQVRDEFVTPTEDGFGANFRSGVGDATVHPHVAYMVIVNEDSNANLTVTEQIPVPDGPTADNIAERTGQEPADYQLDSASATASAANNSSTVIVDVANIGDVDGEQQTVTATGLSSELDNETASQDVTLNAGEEQTVELTLVDAGIDELEAGDQVRIEISLDSGESVKVTAVAE